MPTKLTPQVFSLLAGLLEQRCGLHYVPADLPLVDDRVANRALEIGFDSLLDYYYFLRYDAAGERELDALIEALVVHESYFFREIDQVKALVNVLVAPAALARGAPPHLVRRLCQRGRAAHPGDAARRARPLGERRDYGQRYQHQGPRPAPTKVSMGAAPPRAAERCDGAMARASRAIALSRVPICAEPFNGSNST